MNRLYRIRLRQVLIYGWKDSKLIAKQSGLNRLSAYLNIIRCFRKFYVFSLQYRDNRLWELNDIDLKERAITIGQNNLRRDNWVTDKFENHRFITKWSQHKWDDSPELTAKRRQAYTNFFKTGKDLHVQYNVEIRREHYLEGTLKIGNNVLLAKNVFLDYSGELIIQDNVKLAHGVIVETHDHKIFSDPNVSVKKAYPTKLVISEGAIIGARAVILPSCHYIGKHARIGAGAVVTKDIPDYAVAVGVPARVVRELPHED